MIVVALAFLIGAGMPSPVKAVVHRGGEYWGHELAGHRFQTCDGFVFRLDPKDRVAPINVSCKDLGLDEHALKRHPTPKPHR